MAWIARRLDLRDENAALLLLGLVVLALITAQLLNLSTLLVPLLAGVLLRNTTERPWVWPRHFGTAGGVLVLMLFVIVGSAPTWPAIVAGAAAAGVLLLARAAAKTAVVLLLAYWSGLRPRQALGLSLALMPMSGTALVLLADLQRLHRTLRRWWRPSSCRRSRSPKCWARWPCNGACASPASTARAAGRGWRGAAA